MIRVTFDPHFIDELQDYHRRNECIREQQYLSPEKLLQLAAFCVSTAFQVGPDREIALDIVRQLTVLCDSAGKVQLEPAIVVKGQTDQEKRNDECQAMAIGADSMARFGFDWTRMKSAASSIRDCSRRWLTFATRTPRNQNSTP